MRARQRKKLAKRRRLEQERRERLYPVLGRVFADEILLELQRPSRVSGTVEEWLAWDNLRHPNWTRTSWGSRPPLQGILQVREVRSMEYTLDSPSWNKER